MFSRYLSILFCLFSTTVNAFHVSPNRDSVVSRHMLYMTQDEIPPRYQKKMPLKAQWLPIVKMNAPKILDGTFAGDVGFDPCGFAKSKNALYWMREAEIKHARLAMLAAVGWPLSELWHENIAGFFHLDSILASEGKAPSILNGGLSSVYAFGMLMTSSLVAGYLENKSMASGEIFWNAIKPDGYIPGDYKFDPLNLYNVKGDKKSDGNRGNQTW